MLLSSACNLTPQYWYLAWRLIVTSVRSMDWSIMDYFCIFHIPFEFEMLQNLNCVKYSSAQNYQNIYINDLLLYIWLFQCNFPEIPIDDSCEGPEVNCWIYSDTGLLLCSRYQLRVHNHLHKLTLQTNICDSSSNSLFVICRALLFMQPR